MSAGSSKVCEPDRGLNYDIAVKFDGGDYVKAVMEEIVAGKFKEGDTKHVQGRRRPRAGRRHLQPDARRSRRRWTRSTRRSPPASYAEQFGADRRPTAFAEG